MTQIGSIVHLLRDVLGADLAGAYLHGSAVLGGPGPGSDVDVLAVTRRPTTHAQRRALVEGLFPISGGGSPPVELAVVVQSEVRPWRYPPRGEFLYGEWLRADFERGETPAPVPSPDLALLITVVLLGDTPLYGPPPADLLDPVPPGDLVRAMAAAVPDLLGDLDWDTANVILTFARIWTTLATGEIRRKDAAADWVLPRLPEPHRPVLAHARAIYLGAVPDRWDEDLRARVRPHLDQVLAQIGPLIAVAPG
jgi:streptomycin 3"-adenylyltransferase